MAPLREMGILTEPDLMEWSGIRQRAALRKELRRIGIPFREFGGKLTTTVDAFNAVLVGREKQNRGPNLDAITAKGAR